MLLENFKKFITYYGKGRKLKLVGFFLLSLIAGLFEFVGIALIYPFIMLLVMPENIIHSKIYMSFTHYIHIHNFTIVALILGLFVIMLFVAKNLFMIWNLYLQNKFINNWKLDINKVFMNYYLFAPYKNLLKTAPSEKIYNLTFLTTNTLDGFVLRVIILATNIIITAMILLLLFVKFPIAAVITTIFVLVSMLIQGKFFKERTTETSKKLYKASMLSNNKTIEGINNLKELKILSAEENFLNDYVETQTELNQLLFENNFYSSIPPYIIEIFIVLSLLIMAGIIYFQSQDVSGTIASYAIIVAAIFRIAPALNRIQISINVINNSRGFVKAMLKEYEDSDFSAMETKCNLEIDIREYLVLNNIRFAYAEKQIIKGLNLVIKKGEFIGIIGLSGAGKSTLADIIMGLLPVDSGEVLVDGLRLTKENFCALRSLIGYVPQQINVLDCSFKKNIAWGIDEKNIDEEKVINALKMAQLYDFVMEFDQGLDANVIVGSSSLSQGQKQRLAIARALYRDPKILIFDEATSALDVETEYEITQMLNTLKGEKTIIAIAHRLSTLKSCNRLIYLKDGVILDSGTFGELSERHADFENLIKLSNLNTI